MLSLSFQLVTGSTLHACITYGIAKQTNTDHIANHFIGGIGCGIAAIPVRKFNLAIIHRIAVCRSTNSKISPFQ